MSILKPCGACGTPAVAGPADLGEAATLGWVIVCPQCGAATESFAEIEAAAACWNRRPDGDEEWAPLPA